MNKESIMKKVEELKADSDICGDYQSGYSDAIYEVLAVLNEELNENE